MTDGSAGEIPGTGRRRPRGAVREGLVAAGVELARAGGPDAVVLREAARMVGVVPNAAYRHFAAQLTALVKTRLRRMQDRPAPLEGFVASTGLDLTPFCNPRQ